MIKIVSLSITPKNTLNAFGNNNNIDMIIVNDINFTSLIVKIATVNDVYQNETRFFLDKTKGTLFLSVCLSVCRSVCLSICKASVVCSIIFDYAWYQCCPS